MLPAASSSSLATLLAWGEERVGESEASLARWLVALGGQGEAWCGEALDRSRGEKVTVIKVRAGTDMYDIGCEVCTVPGVFNVSVKLFFSGGEKRNIKFFR